MLAKPDPIRYEDIVAAYQRSLVDVLRGHAVGEPYLELWVPDEDPVKSILNMVEAAQSAGRDAIAIRVSSKTLGAADLARFRTMARSHGQIAVRELGDDYVLDISRLRATAAPLAKGKSDRVAPAGPVERTALRREQETAAADTHRPVVNPALADAVAARQGAITHEGEASPAEGALVIQVKSQIGRLSAAVDAASHTILSARHADIASAPRRAIADLICEIVEGRPVQDAADHAAIIAIHRLSAGAARPVAGIVLPSNSGTAFTDVLDLVRQLRATHAELTGLRDTTSFYGSPPGAAWLALAPGGKSTAIEARLAEFVRRRGLPAAAVALDRIDKDINGFEIRLVVTLADVIPIPERPLVLRALEAFLKQEIDESLQVYLEPQKDLNKIRRL